jgi:4a-hydroxytetrahydrobiopterin dehydratase
MKKYDALTILPELENLKGWYINQEYLEKKYQFKDFIQALAFMVKVGLVAEKLNHHPEIFNVYNKITLRLNSHDAKCITDKDIDLAKSIDKIE